MPHMSTRAWTVTALDQAQVFNVGALVIRIGSWGPLNDDYNKEPPK